MIQLQIESKKKEEYFVFLFNKLTYFSMLIMVRPFNLFKELVQCLYEMFCLFFVKVLLSLEYYNASYIKRKGK